MGNSPSIEVKRSSKAAHKLSKPRMGNVATAGLLSPKVLPDSTRQSTSNPRRTSLPAGPSSVPSPVSIPVSSVPVAPVLSPKLPVKDVEPIASPVLAVESIDGDPGDRSSRRMSRSESSWEPPRHQHRSNSFGVMDSPQIRCRPVRANSVNIGPGESYATHFNLQSLSKNGSRTSVNYDLASYEAKRLLNLAEESPRENKPMMLRNYCPVPEAAWNAAPVSQQPPKSSTMSPLPRAHSDVTLYTPMRRKSLMTPGIATRTTPSYPVPSIPKTRYSLPSTPSRRESLESIGVGTAAVKPLIASAGSIPRALTPCEADYNQTGAFKLGTLRIINGSPSISPTVDSSDDEDNEEVPKQLLDQSSSLHNGLKAVGAEEHLVCPIPIHVSSPKIESGGSFLTMAPREPKTGSDAQGQFSSEVSQSPQLISSAAPKSFELQVTSKHTAAEDDLFEDEPQEYDAEVLDVRVDPNAKSIPPRPRLSSNDRDPQAINRSDSGIVASPTSESSQRPLAKADSGYSSNVSLRSLSTKMRGKEKKSPQPVPSVGTPTEKPHGEIPAPVVTQNVTGNIPDVTISAPEGNAQSPSLPEKTCATLGPNSQRAPLESSGVFRQNFRRLRSRSSLKKSEVPLNSSLEPPEPSPISSTSSSVGSSSSIGSRLSFRKLGKLQRLLSGSRKSKTVRGTHDTENTDIPPTPKSVQLPERSRKRPKAFKKLAIKPEPSKETLGTIMSVGSAELRHERETLATQVVRESGHSGSPKDRKPRKRRSTIHAHSISATISRAASILSRKSTTTEALPSRDGTDYVTEGYPAMPGARGHNAGQAPGQITAEQDIVGEAVDFAYMGIPTLEQEYIEPIAKRNRSISMTAQMERNMAPSLIALRSSEGTSRSESFPVNSLEVPNFARHITGSRTPPPVSMRTRNMGPLQALPPTRPRSTPPGTLRARDGPSLSRRVSQEYNYTDDPALDFIVQSSNIISRRPSRESTTSYQTAPEEAPSAQHSQELVVDPRRFTSYRGQLQTPSWEVQTDHGPSTSRPSTSRQSSFNRSRQNSLASRSSQQSSSIAGSMPFERQQLGNPPVSRSHSSHEVYQEPESYTQDNGPYPSMIRSNGQSFVSDPWTGQSILQQPQRLDQYSQYGQYPTQVPRGQLRHRGLEPSIHRAPYRVLHSYNSPAYRNVPIWG
ncbi:hypothetical protein F4810DRAFT_30697 [Camillea tinctor]|nr:hypothetical protein F4810DRAFT_30697 [Camillea tinctor]